MTLLRIFSRGVCLELYLYEYVCIFWREVEQLFAD